MAYDVILNIPKILRFSYMTLTTQILLISVGKL